MTKPKYPPYYTTIKRLMRERRLTQSALVQRINQTGLAKVTPANFSQAMTGKRGFPQIWLPAIKAAIKLTESQSKMLDAQVAVSHGFDIDIPAVK